MSNEWKEVNLSEVCELITRGITPSYTEDNGVIVINQKCIRDNRVNFNLARLTNPNKKNISEQKYLKSYDVLVNSTGVGTLGRVAQLKLIKKLITCDSHVTIVRANENVYPVYLGYNLFMQQPSIENLAEGSTGQTELSRSRLGEAIKLLIPSLEEQKAIAHILSTLDERIDINNQINKILEEIAQTMFKRWFVDFEFPNEDGEPYKSSGGKMVESELGMIPMGWGVKKIGDLCNITSSKRIFMNEYVSEGIPFYRGKEIIEKSKGEAISTRLYISIDRYNEIKSKNLVPQKGDILLTSVGTLGIAYKVDDEPFYFKDGNLTWFRDFKEKEYSNYLYIWLQSEQGKENLDSITIGSTQKALTIDSMKNIKLVQSSNIILKQFEGAINKLIDMIYLSNIEKEKLSNIRNTILPKLMSGEIRVPLD